MELLWGASLLLQLLLVLMLLRRGVWRQLPSFALLLTFYPLRSAALYQLYGHIPSDLYSSLAQTLSILALLLGVAVSIELLFRLRGGGSRSWWPVLAIPGTAWLLTMILVATLPTHTAYPLDRLHAFVAAMFIGEGVWALADRVGGLVAAACLGLAGYAVVDLSTTVAKVCAAARRNSLAFEVAAYLDVLAYLAAVIFWSVSLWKLRAGRPLVASPAAA